MLNVLLAIFLAAVGLAIFGYLGTLLWIAAFGPVSGGFARGRLRRCEERLAKGEASLREGDHAAAVAAFSDAIYTSPATTNEMATAVANHHTGVLSRFIAVADERHGGNVGLLSLAVADRVLRKRKALQSSYLGAVQTGTRSRRRDLEKELRANSDELRKAVSDLASEIMAAGSGSSLH